MPLLLFKSFSSAYKVVIYTGVAADCADGDSTNSTCWDAAGTLLDHSGLPFIKTFLDQAQMMTADLSDIDLYIQPGGGSEFFSIPPSIYIHSALMIHCVK